jgi:hypothetical protein
MIVLNVLTKWEMQGRTCHAGNYKFALVGGAQLMSSQVDLARNDVNRVCDPMSTRVDRLMVVQKFSHVQHLVSEVSGVLRPDKTRFDAFR